MKDKRQNVLFSYESNLEYSPLDMALYDFPSFVGLENCGFVKKPMGNRFASYDVQVVNYQRFLI